MIQKRVSKITSTAPKVNFIKIAIAHQNLKS